MRNGVRLILEKLCGSITACHSRETVVNPAKLHPSWSKISRIWYRILGGKSAQSPLIEDMVNVGARVSSKKDATHSC